jgi:redox-sensitive bicupin YhaK (pirin superfamily)
MVFHGGGSDRRAVALTAADIPEVDARGARVRVLAGDALGARARLSGPLTVLDVHLAPGAEVAHVTPQGHHAWALAIVGDGFAGPESSELSVKQASAVAFGHDGDSVRLRAGSLGLHALFAHAPGKIRSQREVSAC